MSNIIFVNPDKKKRADTIFVSFSKAPKTEEENTLKERHLELLKEAGVNIKDKEETILAIYRNLGGAVRTAEEDAKIRAKSKKGKKLAKVEKDDEKVEDDEDDDEE